MTSIPPAVQRDIQRLVAAIPELASDPFYYLNYDRSAAIFQEDSLGLAFVGNDEYAVENLLREKGAWRGPGRVVAINGGELRRLNQDDDSFRQHCNSVSIHEISHHLPSRPCFSLPEPETEADKKKLLDCIQRVSRRELQNQIAATEPWALHGLSFIRVCCHVAFRAKQLLDILFLMDEVAAGRAYGLSSFSQYFAAFEDEAERMADKPFSLITAWPFPADAEQLFGQDVERWHSWNNSITQWRQQA